MELAARLACPYCRAHPLSGASERLTCPACRREFAVRDGVPDLLPADVLGPQQLRTIAEWEDGADQYRTMVAALGDARFAPIDGPLLRLAGGDVVEVGCGDGRLLERLGGVPTRSRLGVEPSRPLASAAAAAGLPVVRGCAERLPLPDRSADALLAGYYALRYADLDAALAEASRVLRPCGRLGFTLLGRRAVTLASRLAAGRLLFDDRSRWAGAQILFGQTVGVTLPNDVSSAAVLCRRLERAGFAAVEVLGTPYVPLVSTLTTRAFGRSLPYLRGEAAARFGFDVVVLARRA